jgi:hypothetical protein
MSDGTYNATFNLRTLMQVVDGTTGEDELYRPGSKVLLVDFLDQNFQEILNRITSWDDYVWTGEKIQTACYRYYGTTNAWFLVLAFNGLSTPMELRPGMLLRMPRLNTQIMNPIKVPTRASANRITI